jgi:hypothetical protein
MSQFKGLSNPPWQCLPPDIPTRDFGQPRQLGNCHAAVHEVAAT